MLFERGLDYDRLFLVLRLAALLVVLLLMIVMIIVLIMLVLTRIMIPMKVVLMVLSDSCLLYTSDAADE